MELIGGKSQKVRAYEDVVFVERQNSTVIVFKCSGYVVASSNKTKADNSAILINITKDNKAETGLYNIVGRLLHESDDGPFFNPTENDAVLTKLNKLDDSTKYAILDSASRYADCGDTTDTVEANNEPEKAIENTSFNTSEQHKREVAIDLLKVMLRNDIMLDDLSYKACHMLDDNVYKSHNTLEDSILWLILVTYGINYVSLEYCYSRGLATKSKYFDGVYNIDEKAVSKLNSIEDVRKLPRNIHERLR